MHIKSILLLTIYLITGILIGYFLHGEQKLTETVFTAYKTLSELSSNVNIIQFNQSLDQNLTCIKTKTLLNHISTVVCLHEKAKDVFVSGSFGSNSIWEEDGVTRILKLLLRHPHLDFIDIGANIGTYTMYAASLGRFVLSIDCFAPNVQRIQRAVQLTNLANRVVLIQNAIYSHSGQYLSLSNDARNIGGQELDTTKNLTTNQSVINNPYMVKTIKFDDLLPILTARKIRGAVMKVDIEGSESFVLESGSQIFDSIEIPYVQMEWLKVRFIPDRVKIILDFFTQRNYDPMTFSCQLLLLSQNLTWPHDFCWIKRNVPNFC